MLSDPILMVRLEAARVLAPTAGSELALDLLERMDSAIVNLVDLYRAGSNKQAADNAGIHYALGLFLVRQKRLSVAPPELELPTSLDVENGRYIYLLAVAFNSRWHPLDSDIMGVLVTFHKSPGQTELARAYLKKLQSVPQQPGRLPLAENCRVCETLPWTTH